MSNFVTLRSQCDCPIGALTVSTNQTQILPFCDEILINTLVTNARDIEGCSSDFYIRVSIGNLAESTDPLSGFNYLGDLPFAFEDWYIDNNITWRRFFLKVDDLPDLQSLSSQIRFSLEPSTNQSDLDHFIYVDLAPQEETNCGSFSGSGASVFEVVRRLVEVPISGKVSDLIAAGRLENVPSGTFVEHKTIEGVLEVDQDYSFDGSGGAFRPTLYLLPGTQILVRAGSTFTMLNADLFTCDTLATGLTLEPGATLVATTSTIKDCRFAIDAKPGSTIKLVSNDFSDNYIGLNLDMNGVPEADKRVNILAMTGNSFSTAAAAIKAPYSGMPEPVEARGYCGIRLNQYRDFNLFSSNTFSALANGIIGFNSTGNIGNMTFNGMNSVDQTPVYQHEGYGIYLASKGADWFNINFPFSTMTFNNCKTGIRAINYAGKVQGTVMTNVNTGIDWSNSHTRDVRLFDNTITARHFGIRSGLNEPLHPISAIGTNTVTITGALTPDNNLTRGIEMNEFGFGYTPSGGTAPVGLEGWDAGENTVTMEQGGIGIGYRNGVSGTVHENTVVNETQPNVYTGILAEGALFSDLTGNTVTQVANGLGTSTAIHSSAGVSNTVQCNCVDNTDIGLLFLDMAEFTDAVRGNSMNTHCTGLQLNAGAFVGEQKHTGNIWDLSASSGNCLGGRNFSDPEYSRFLVDGNANTSLNPPVWPDEIWFFDETGTTYAGCAACTFPFFAPPRVPESSVPTILDQDIAAGDFFPDPFVHEMQWKGAYRLYRKVLRHPSLENFSQQFEDFKADNDSLSTGRLAYIAEERSKIFAFSAAQDSLLELYRLGWHDGMADLLALDSLRQAGDTSVLVSQYDSAVLHSTAVRTQYTLYHDTLQISMRAKIQMLLTANAAISTSITPADNHKAVNSIVFGLLLNDTLATGDLATLESIAEMCPLEGGDAVYEARAIVAHMTGASYDDAEICDLPEEMRRPQKPETVAGGPSSIMLFPNPSTGQVYWRGTGDQTVRVRVFSAVGQLLGEVISATGFANLDKMPEGLHLIQLLSLDNNLLATRKIHLIKR
ncbi:MAG: hypothetical protein ABMA02_13035 [Saprospiraceae bacterium]